MGGKPCIRDMRVTVGTIVGLFAAGRSEQEILQAYPDLQAESKLRSPVLSFQNGQLSAILSF